MVSDYYGQIYGFLEQTPVISTHEHHLEDKDQNQLTLEEIFNHSYVGWLNIPIGSNKEEHRAFLDKIRYNSYFVWLEKSLRKLYNFGNRITPELWDDLSKKIREKHSDPEEHLNILRDKCRYKFGLADIYWNTGSDLGHPELFRPVLRTDMFVKCFHPSQKDHDGNSPWDFFPIKGLSFGEYIEYLIEFHREKVKSGAVAFKLATAYERPIKINKVSYDKAAHIYLKDPKEVSKEDAMAYGDYIINRISALATELGVPYQIHTGLGQLSGSNPMLLESTIERYPETRFVLFHGGYPWYHEIAALAHNYNNVLIDLVWLPLISTSAAIRALHEYIEISQSIDYISWGSDSWTSEEALGALLAYEHVVATVLAEKIDDGYISFEEAKVLAEKLMYKNALQTYNLIE